VGGDWGQSDQVSRKIKGKIERRMSDCGGA